jgi:integrase
MAVYRRGRVHWYTFTFNGLRVQCSAKTKNAKVAADIERAAWNNLARGVVGLPAEGPQKIITVADLLDGLEAAYKDEKKTSQQAQSVIKLARRAFGSKIASQLTPKDVDEYIAEKRKQGKKNATINRVTEILRRAYRVAEIPAPKIRHLSEHGNARKGFFADAEFRSVYSHLPELRDFALFGYLTGWRKGEIASLTWQDVEDGVIRLRGEHSKNREARSVVIAGELVGLIERRKQARLVNGVLTHLVFHRENGERVQEIRKAWASACKKAGVARLFHDLRRTAVRYMVRSGVPQSVAMKISGHKTASIFRRYDIANEDDLRQAIEAVQRYHKAEAEKVVSLSSQ